MGSGDYVADALATPELARRHPRFCVITSNGRCFRLAPAGGLMTIEQAGALGDPGGRGVANDQPAFQAAVDYAAAVGIARIGLSKPSYSLWMPPRTLPLAEGGAQGNAITLGQDQKIHFIGLGKARTIMRFFAPGGRSLDGITAGKAFHLVGGKVWRGSGFYLPSTTRVNYRQFVRSGARQSLTLEHLVVDGGTRMSDYSGIPARPTDGKGWDVTHKGIHCQSDRRGSDITVLDCEMTGWRGETIYASNDPSSQLIVRNSTFSQSNGQGLNPNGCMVDVEDCKIYSCYMGIEGWTGLRAGRISRVEIVDCVKAFTIDGGYYDHRKQVASAPGPTPPADFGPAGTLAAQPFDPGKISIVVRHSGRAYIGSWLSGSIEAVDTTIVIGDGTATPGGANHVDLDLTMISDRTDLAFVIIANRQRGVRTNDVHLRIQAKSTAAALAADRRPGAAITWHGLLGPDISVVYAGREGRQLPHADAPVVGPAPRITSR